MLYFKIFQKDHLKVKKVAAAVFSKKYQVSIIN